ncbi:MAG: protein phosphatase 2C domain-containing protein [Gammaproteobacteria bacterium]|nr:protein phosphatase 2C domain-containing protein [Gammaproteobacteria bacterium]
MTNSIVVVETSMNSLESVSIGNYEIIYYTQKLESKNINEDGLLVMPISHGVVLAVADGVGGSEESYRAVKCVLNNLSDFYTKLSDKSINALLLVQETKYKLQEINSKILNLSNTPQTTLSLAVMISKKIYIFQVGDSGILLAGLKGKLKFLTPFQSEVGELVQQGKITPELALSHPRLNIVNNVLGYDKNKFYVSSFLPHEISSTGTGGKFAKYDTMLLATDGLFDNYTPKELVKVIRKGQMSDIANYLIDSVTNNTHMINSQQLYKKDDVTFIICRRKQT